MTFHFYLESLLKSYEGHSNIYLHEYFKPLIKEHQRRAAVDRGRPSSGYIQEFT